MNMKTINLELSKKLQEHLKDIETEYYYEAWLRGKYFLEEWISSFDKDNWDIKTLTLEEAIEFLPETIILNDHEEVELSLYKRWVSYDYFWFEEYGSLKFFEDEASLLQAIEKMLEWLLNNNYLLEQNLLPKS